jgi:hypothetical protein
VGETESRAGRNDPCPCGSGKKHKKCCLRKSGDQEAAESPTQVHDLIDENTIPLKVIQILGACQNDNLPALYHETLHELGPARAQEPHVEAFARGVREGTSRIPGGDRYELTRLRIDGPDALIMLVRGASESQRDEYLIDIITFRPNEFDGDREARDVEHPGWRIWDLATHRIPKENKKTQSILFEDFEISWAAEWQRPVSLDEPAAEESSTDLSGPESSDSADAEQAIDPNP